MTQAAARVEEIDVAKAARLAGCSADTMRRLLESGAVDGWRLTPRSPWRVDKASVLRYLNRVKRNDH